MLPIASLRPEDGKPMGSLGSGAGMCVCVCASQRMLSEVKWRTTGVTLSSPWEASTDQLLQPTDSSSAASDTQHRLEQFLGTEAFILVDKHLSEGSAKTSTRRYRESYSLAHTRLSYLKVSDQT